MRPAYVRGLGCWTPGFPNAAAWCRGVPEPSALAPEAKLLAGPLRRRTSQVSRMAVDVLQQAAEAGGADLARVPTVWATVYGEHEAAIAILGMIQRGDGKVSPARFHNCVYNAPSGQASIACRNRSLSTTVTGGTELVGGALLESLCLLQAGFDDVVLVLADEPLLPPFATGRSAAPLALAFLLSGRPQGALAVLADPRLAAATPVKRREPFGDLAVSAGLPLLERIARRRPGCVALELEGETRQAVWCVDVGLVDRSDPTCAGAGAKKED